MAVPDFKQNYFQLFELPVSFTLDSEQLARRFRSLQQGLHPDRHSRDAAHEQRVAVQYSSLVNQAYTTLRSPLSRAIYLLQMAGLDQAAIDSHQVDGGFLIEQMELREKLESIEGLVDPDSVLEHLRQEIGADLVNHRDEFRVAYDNSDLAGACSAVIKMQFLEKLMQEAEQVESRLLD